MDISENLAHKYENFIIFIKEHQVTSRGITIDCPYYSQLLIFNKY